MYQMTPPQPVQPFVPQPEITEEPVTTQEPEETEAPSYAGMAFTQVNEPVTAKDATNLRNVPSQGEDSQVMTVLKNGQVATRIGISETGWSKLEYNGETYYAVSSLLTTDLTVKPEPEDAATASCPKTLVVLSVLMPTT